MTSIQLKGARQKLGLTQAQMAPLLNASLSAVQKWESGANGIPGQVGVILALCSKYKGAVKYLLAKYT